jgi:hypothetical protein
MSGWYRWTRGVGQIPTASSALSCSLRRIPYRLAAYRLVHPATTRQLRNYYTQHEDQSVILRDEVDRTSESFKVDHV